MGSTPKILSDRPGQQTADLHPQSMYMHSLALLNSLDVLYDYERQVLSMKAICSPQMECELYDELAYAELEE